MAWSRQSESEVLEVLALPYRATQGEQQMVTPIRVSKIEESPEYEYSEAYSTPHKPLHNIPGRISLSRYTG